MIVFRGWLTMIKVTISYSYYDCSFWVVFCFWVSIIMFENESKSLIFQTKSQKFFRILVRFFMWFSVDFWWFSIDFGWFLINFDWFPIETFLRIFQDCAPFYSYKSRKQKKMSEFELSCENGLWPFTKGNWKVTQKLVLSARNQKLNIATQIFPLTMYPIVLQCFASLTWRNLLSYLCERKKKSFFS